MRAGDPCGTRMGGVSPCWALAALNTPRKSNTLGGKGERSSCHHLMFTETLLYTPESLWKQLPYSVKVHMQDISLWYIGGGRRRDGGKRRREEERGGKEKEVVGEGWVGQREEYYALP